MAATSETKAVSPNNPCPFLRALVAHGVLPDDRAAIGDVTARIVAVAKTGDGQPDLPGTAIRLIALIANGLGPGRLVRNGLDGLHLDQLRGGPLDKQGAGSRILDDHARVVGEELDRLNEFAGDHVDAAGIVERGLDAAALTRMMNANFERAAGHRRRIDRRLMDGEWPVLLRVMGKEGQTGRYLSLA